MTTRANQAYSFVRGRLLSGHHPPGSRLKELELAAEAGLSPTPIRDAFRRLAAEGLLEYRPRRGVVVRQIGSNEIEELYELRQLLEPFAARKAALRIGRVAIKELEECLDIQMDMGRTSSSSEIELCGDMVSQWLEADRRFHEGILVAAGNHFLIRMLDTCRVIAILLARPLHRLTAEQMATTVGQHRKILDSMSIHDPDNAEKYAREHVEFSFNTVIDSIREKA